MIGLCYAAMIFGTLILVLGFLGVVETLLEGEGFLFIASLIACVVGVVAIVFGMVHGNNIERQQCEEAGFEWITGKCYGTNVNLNGKG